jgi:hypothetical protein
MEDTKKNTNENSSFGELEKVRSQQSVDKICKKRRGIYQGFDKADFVVSQKCNLCESSKIEHIFDKEGFGYF